jgi:hypothetical protein
LAIAIANKQRSADIKTQTATLPRDGALHAATNWSVSGRSTALCATARK